MTIKSQIIQTTIIFDSVGIRRLTRCRWKDTDESQTIFVQHLIGQSKQI